MKKEEEEWEGGRERERESQRGVYNSSSAGKRRGSKRLLRTCYTVSSKKTSTPSQRQPPTFTDKHERVRPCTYKRRGIARYTRSFSLSLSLSPFLAKEGGGGGGKKEKKEREREKIKLRSRREVCRFTFIN